MSKHTPGPWYAESCGIYGVQREAIHNGKTCDECGHDPSECGDAVMVAIFPELIADIKAGHWDDVEAPAPADLQLMAAAPDLLEALSKLVKANEQWNASVEAIIGRPPNWNDGYLDTARAAIAKATGDSP